MLEKILFATALAVSSATAFAAEPAVTAASSKTHVPSTPAGIAFAEFINAFNAADRDALADFRKKYERQSTVEEMLQWRDETGGFEILSVENVEPKKLAVVIKERDSEQAYAARFSVDDPQPPRIRFQLEPTPLPPDRAPQRLADDALAQATIARVDAMAKDDKFAGAVAIARGDDVVLERAWPGPNGEKLTPDTQFRLGSMNKMFTAVATMQLVAAGKLSLDDTIAKHLPDYANADLAKKVTVRHLLTHSGGTGDIFGADFDAKRLELRTHDDYRALYEGRALDFEPGTDTRYSNYGFVLLGLLIEKASGQSYYDYVAEHVYAKAGMTASGSEPESTKVANRATGYMKVDGRWAPNTDTLPYRGTAAGGGYSTVRDLMRFARALEAGRLVSKSSLAELTRSQNGNPGYGYGFAVNGAGAERAYGHGGGAPGMNAEFRVYPEADAVVVVLANLDPPAASRVAEFISNRLTFARP